MLKKIIYVLIIIGLVFGAIGFQTPKPVQAASPLRISQMYAGGGTPGDNTTYKQRYVELFNDSSTPASLAGMSLQFANATGKLGEIHTMTFGDKTVAPNGYFLVQIMEAPNGEASIPTPDETYGVSVSVVSGKVALVNGSEPLNCNGTSVGATSPCSDEQLARIVDLLGYGTSTTFYEGGSVAPRHDTNLSTQRKNGGCQDTDNNGADFIAATPIARNSDSPTHSCAPASNPDAIFFSEYIEGSSFNKALEIYNATGATVDLSDIKIELYPNGATSPAQSVVLFGTLVDKGTFVAAHNQAAQDILDKAQLTDGTVVNFNGDDAVVLRRVSTDAVLDTIGQVGNRPAAGYWGTGDVTTKDDTLVRKPDVCAGDTTPDDAYDPANEWLGYSINTFTHLGSHESNCNQTPIPGPKVQSIVPANNAMAPKTTDIVITFSEEVTVEDGWYDVTCTETGTHTATVTEENPVFTLNPDEDFTPDETCTVTIYKDKVTNAADETMAENFVSSFTIVEGCGDAFTPIYAIQGDGPASPFVNEVVTTEGVVTANFQVGGKSGYAIQDPDGDNNPATSDGIFVYSTTPSVNVGDRLRITGKVTEYYDMTQITPTSAATVLTCSTGHEITPTEITLPVTAPRDFEPYEGMLVTFPQALYLAEYFNFDRYGEIMLSGTRHNTPTSVVEPGDEAIAAEQAYILDSIKVDDTLTSQNPPYLRHPDGSQFTKEHYFRGGDTITGLTGIMDYNFNEWKIQPVGTATYTQLNPRPLAPEMAPGEIRIASLNVLNYFVTLDGNGNICGPAGNMNCRGADNQEEFDRQHAKIVAAILGMEADVIGLIEIENEHPNMVADGAVKHLVEALNTETAAGTYDYVATGNIGTDAIKQAFIYKPAKVDRVGKVAILDETFDEAYDTTRNRPSLAVSFKDKITDEIFTVSVNHLKSKGSACDGDPDLGDGQGNCNLTRKRAAEVLVRWLEDDPTEANSDMYVIIGDLNSYAKEDPIDAIKLGADKTAGTADDVTNLVEVFNEPEAYGYVFDGKAGYLDHALANKKFAYYVLDAKFWHINADEADVFDYDNSFKPAEQAALYSPDAYRSSDHDPILISLILNHAPVANDDEYSTNMGVTLEVPAPGVLANDTDANEDDIITATLVEGSGPANGELTFNSDGSFTYIPNPGFAGVDTFKYTMHAMPGIMDAFSDTATVTINVIETNQAPVFKYPIEDESINELETFTMSLVAIDADIPEQAISYTFEGLPEGAEFDEELSNLAWTPTEAQGPDDYTITVKACDDGEPVLCATATFTLTVNEVNIAPRIYPVIEPKEVDELEELSFTIPVEDPDIPANTHTFSMTNAPTGATLDTETGEFVWTPTEEQGPGVYNVTFKVCDDGTPELCDEQVVEITVNEVNQAPVFIYPIEDQEIDELKQISLNFGAKDSDVPEQGITYSIEGLPEGASFDTTTGRFKWTPTEAQGPGEYEMTVKACDDGEPVLCATATFTITVREVNLAPRIYPIIEDMVVNELELIDFVVPVEDKDIPANVLTVTLIDPPEGAEIVEGRFVWTPSEAQGYGEYDITVQVCDDGEPELCGEDTFKVTVNEVNVAPSIEPAIEDMTVNELEEVRFTVPAVDPDIPANVLTFSMTGAPAGATLDPETGEFVWTPTEVQGPGVYTFTLKVCDNGTPSLCDEQELTITVLEANEAPIFKYPIEDQTIDELTPFSWIFKATDSDKPDQTISYSIENAPAGSTFDEDEALFEWTPSEAQGPGEYTITVKACDNFDPPACGIATFTITVLEVNLPPTINPIPAQEVDELSELTFTATAMDPDLPLQVLTFSLENAPDGAVIDPTTGVFTWTPGADMGTNDYTFQVCVTDIAIKVCTDVTVTVNDIPVEPVAVDDAYTTDEDVVLTVLAPGVLANDTDPDSPVLTAILGTGPTHGTLVLNDDGSFTYTPNQDYHGTDSFTYKASDGTNESNIATVTITINSVNDAPVAVDDTYTVVEDAVLTVTAAQGVLANDSDVDGDVLSATLRSNVSHGVLVLLSDGSFTYTPEADFFGTDSFTYTLISHPNTQDAGWTDWATVTITVTPVNDAPILDPIANATIPEMVAYTFTATATDVDSTNLTFSLVNAPAGAAINASTGVFTWTPTEAQGPGSYTFTVKVCDDATPSFCDQQQVTLAVEEVNLAPEIEAIEDQEVTAGEELTFTAVATDPDLPANTLTFRLEDAPTGATIDATTGKFTWTPVESQVGVHEFQVCVTDGLLNACTPVKVTVLSGHVNTPPVAVADAYDVDQDEVLTVDAPGVLANDTDEDNDELTAILVVTTENGTLVLKADGSFVYTPNEGFFGTDTFTYKANDGEADSNVVTVTITVKKAEPALPKGLYFPIILN